MAPGEDIAIIGLSCRFAGDAKDVYGYWDLLRQGKSAFSPKARFDSATSSHPGYYLQDDIYKFDASFFGISPKEAKGMDPSQRLMLEVAYEAFESAGLTLEAVSGSNTCVYAAQWACDYRDMLARDVQNAPTYTATGTGTTLLSNRLSWFFDLRGPSMTINTACSSSMVAVHEACESLRRGESDMALVASANVILCPDMFTYLGMQNFLSASGKCKSFDATGDGYGRGEGFAALVLKRVPSAVKDNSPIRAVIRGTGVNQNGRMKGITLPSVSAQVALIRKTYESAGLPVTETGYVEAHGTGTMAGDPVELEAIGKAFAQVQGSDNHKRVIVGSGKPSIGHTEASAGLASVIRSVLMLESGIIPPNIYLNHINPNLRLDEWNLEIPTQLIPWPSKCDFRRISVCSTGYGGTYAHAIIDESHHYLQTTGLFDDAQVARSPVWAAADQRVQNLYDVTGPTSSWPKRFLLTLSSNHENGIQQQLSSLAQWCLTVGEDDSESILADLAYTLYQRRSQFTWRTSITVSSVTELKEAAENATNGASSHSQRALDDPGVCFIFTGQGAQWPRMGQTLYLECAVFRASIDAADHYFRDILQSPWSVVDELFRDEQKSLIDQHAFSQPLTTVLQMGLVDLLQGWNIKPDWIIGHSSGEIAGAYCLGVLTQHDAWRIAYSCGAFESDQEGSMMAVGLSETEATSIINQHALGRVVVACINSPSNVTLSGDSPSLEILQQILHNRGIFNQRLHVDAAYHSSHMEAMTKNYQKAISQVVLGESIQGRTMFSSVTGKEINASELGSTYWSRNLVSQVKFSDAVTQLLESFPTRNKIFVEIGPHQTMQAPLKQILISCSASESYEYVSVLSRGKDSVATTYAAAGRLYALGLPVNVAKLNETVRRPKLIVDLPPYSWRHEDSYNAIEPAAEQRSHQPARGNSLPRRICFSLGWQPAPDISTETVNEAKDVTLFFPNRPTQTLRGLSGVVTQRLRSSGFNVESATWPAIGHSNQGRRCISLVELDAPIFENASAIDIEVLQRIVADSKSMLWLSLNTPGGSIVPALAQTIRNETPGLQFRSLQVASPYSSRIADLGNIIAQLAMSNTPEMEFRESNNTLFVPRVNEDNVMDDVLQRFLSKQALAASKSDHLLQPDATYVLAGGLGGLGRNIATFLVDLGAKHICFLSRSPTKFSDTETFLAELRKRNVSVSAYKCDISDMRSLRITLRQCRQEHPPIKGIIQCAMVLRDVSFQKMTHQQWKEALQPKVQGSNNLVAVAVEPRQNPFFIMLSSFTAIFGNRTQANYVAACAYQDALAHDLCARGIHAVSLDLGIMRDAGYIAENGSMAALKDWEQGFGLREYEMRALLHAAIAKQTPTQPVTGLPTAVTAAAAGIPYPFFLDVPKFTAISLAPKQPATTTSSSLPQLDRTAPGSKGQISTAFQEAIADALHMSVADVDLTRALHALGVDSLIVIEVQSWLFRTLGVRLSPHELMADVPLLQVVESVWEKWQGGDGGLK
ncbi:polyketide synthase [Colletotrichum truncatum]|uniref:Polyketide synthase n=1 Tax=Colletotrichum truncatum TaxID=5467 RepID=A0ACC3YQ58_COLTU|nr:polyketide synthase [Colletotrichum truncatum]KAF6796679.1 polyketide synthase [Colletotrichum truncatum]